VLVPGGLIPQAFFLRPVEVVARELLGACLCREGVVLRLTEVEAYGGPEDSASHCRFGRTARNAPMWCAGGRAYVFVCYGLHAMLNVVAGPEGAGAAVLLRAAEVLEGHERVRERRGGRLDLAGPGKLAQALALDRSYNDHPLFEAGGLELRKGYPPRAVLCGPRVGVDYAEPCDRERPWRFADAEGPRPVQARSLGPLESEGFRGA
jgi:DNA-3-methyladenine glycosylase